MPFAEILDFAAVGLRLAEIGEVFVDWPFVVVAFVTFADSKSLVDSASVVALLGTVGHRRCPGMIWR